MGNVENVRMVKEALTEAINEVCKEKCLYKEQGSTSSKIDRRYSSVRK